jgi:hypothetical protein
MKHAIYGIISAFCCQCVEDKFFNLFLSMHHRGMLLQLVVEQYVLTNFFFFFWFLICDDNRQFLG